MILRRNLMKKTRKSRVFRVEFRVSKLEKSSFSSRVSSRVYSKSRVFRVGFRVWVLKTRTWLETRKKSSSIVWYISTNFLVDLRLSNKIFLKKDSENDKRELENRLKETSMQEALKEYSQMSQMYLFYMAHF